MKRVIAIPLAGGKLSAHFGHSEAFAFISSDDKVIKSLITLDPPEHVPGSFPRWVAEHGATEVIAGGMGPQAVSLFNSFGINVFVGAPPLDPLEIAQLFLDGKLPLQANYCDHDGHHHDAGHHHDHHHQHSQNHSNGHDHRHAD